MLQREALPEAQFQESLGKPGRYPQGKLTAPVARRASGPKLPFLTAWYVKKYLILVKEGGKKQSFGLL